MLADFLFLFLPWESIRCQPSSRQAIRSISVLLLICIIHPILKSDKIIQQTWNAESFTEAVVVIKAMDKRHLPGNNLDWFKHLDFQGSVQELLAHDLGPTHRRIQAALI